MEVHHNRIKLILSASTWFTFDSSWIKSESEPNPTLSQTIVIIANSMKYHVRFKFLGCLHMKPMWTSDIDMIDFVEVWLSLICINVVHVADLECLMLDCWLCCFDCKVACFINLMNANGLQSVLMALQRSKHNQKATCKRLPQFWFTLDALDSTLILLIRFWFTFDAGIQPTLLHH